MLLVVGGGGCWWWRGSGLLRIVPRVPVMFARCSFAAALLAVHLRLGGSLGDQRQRGGREAVATCVGCGRGVCGPAAMGHRLLLPGGVGVEVGVGMRRRMPRRQRQAQV